MKFARVSGRDRVAPSQAVVLSLLFLVSLLTFLDRHMLGILLPAIKHDLHLSDAELGFMAGAAFSVVHAVMGIPLGYFADRFSARRVIAGALAFWSAMTVLCGLTQGFGQLVAARALVGVGEGGSMPAANALIADLVPEAQRARALSIFAMGLPAGLFLGFLGGGAITQAVGWRAALLTFGFPGLILAVVVLLALPRSATKTSVDPAPLGPALTSVLSRPSFCHICFGSALFTLAWQGMVAWLPSYFTRMYGLPLAVVGAKLALVLAASQAVGLLVGGFGGDVMARRGARWPLWICGAAGPLSVPFFFIVFAGLGANVALLALAPGIAVGLVQGVPALATVHAVTDAGRRGVAFAVYQMIVNLVAGMGALLIGVVSDRLAPSFGSRALGLAILGVVVTFCIWSALHFWLGSRRVEADARRGPAMQIA